MIAAHNAMSSKSRTAAPSGKPATSAEEAKEKLLARVKDVSDVLDLARTNHLGFTVASQDADAGIVMSTMPVDSCPVNMMKARAFMPCSSDAFLKYLEFDVRRRWDDHFSHGHVVQTIDDQTQLKYMSFHSPIPFLAARDFELVVHETYDAATKTSILKAISTPEGQLVPLPGASKKVVRGAILLSGFVVRPVERGMEPPLLQGAAACCEVTYIALVHPRGWIPPAFVNMVIGKQTSALRALQSFIGKNPVPPTSSRGHNPTDSQLPHSSGTTAKRPLLASKL